MFRVINDEIYFKNVKIATFNKLIPSFRDEVENALKNRFFTTEEIEYIKDMARK